jgi:hypothetical protein
MEGEIFAVESNTLKYTEVAPPKDWRATMDW